jgi:predicted phosphodiesterase
MARTLVFGDLHLPFIREGYLEFLKKVYKSYQCDTIVCVGDLFDLHRISRHLPHPDAKGAKEEYLEGMDIAHKLYKLFPKVYACIGNHDARLYRQAAEKSIPSVMLKSYQEWTQAPKGWKWALKHTIDGVLYTHGTAAKGGEFPHVTIAKAARMSTVIGHIHTAAGVHYMASDNDLIFAMACGCGMDSKSYAAQYAEELTKKPIVGCAVVIDGTQPIYIPMPLGSKVRRIR